MVDLNPKLKDSGVIDCKPQKGKCPLNCNQCFYNREGAFYTDVNRSQFPSPFEVGQQIVRVNSGHDSNIDKEMVIKETEQYEHKFYNTSIMDFDFPAPVVFTANRKEEETISTPNLPLPSNLMFVRLRVSDTNLDHVHSAVSFWTKHNIPVVLTFMAYYSEEPKNKENYEWQVRHTNSYWCPTKKFMKEVLKRMKKVGGRTVTICGTLDSRYCEQCGNCKNYYLQTIKHMAETEKEKDSE